MRGFYYGLGKSIGLLNGSDYKCGLKYIFVWGVKQHISLGEFSAGVEYIMRGGGL